MMKPFGSLLFAVSFAVLIICIYSPGVDAQTCSLVNPNCPPMQCCVVLAPNFGQCRNLAAKGEICEMKNPSELYVANCPCANGAMCTRNGTRRICQ
uniref:U2-Liphistoxin-Lsp1d_1 n=1 Tax=Liphistius sp. SGP-2016 TaxID=1905180 RepID=A0A4Q8K884_9ARAC